jgi:hypothetical protein
MPMVHLSAATREKSKKDFITNNDVNLGEGFGKAFSEIVLHYLDK